MMELETIAKWEVESFGNNSEKRQQLSELLQKEGYITEIKDQRNSVFSKQYFHLDGHTADLIKFSIEDNQLMIQLLNTSSRVVIASLDGDKISFRDHAFSVLSDCISKAPQSGK